MFGISHQKAGLNWPGRHREAIQNAELKMQNGNNGNGAPQRRGDAEPFLDEWSKAEAFARDWLEAMRAGFG